MSGEVSGRVVVRTAVRVILVDAGGRTLLFRGGDPGRPEAGTWWFTPGGGVEDGESRAAAARREVLEETGIRVDGLGDVVLSQSIEFEFEGALIRQSEHFHLVHLPGHAPAVAADGWTDLERRSVVDARWWRLEDLRCTTDTVYPTGLADLMAGLLTHHADI